MIITIKFWAEIEDGLEELVELVIEPRDEVYTLYKPEVEGKDQYMLKGNLESLREVTDTIRGAMGWED